LGYGKICISLYPWYTLKDLCILAMEKSSDIDVSHRIVDDLHGMYISIKPNESIEIFIECKKLEMTMKIKHHNPDKYGQNACGILQLIKYNHSGRLVDIDVNDRISHHHICVENEEKGVHK
jgi:hypothetical protein